jgi:hypothetical protein
MGNMQIHWENVQVWGRFQDHPRDHGRTRVHDPNGSERNGDTNGSLNLGEKQVDEHVKRGIMLAENLKTAYSLIYGQCSNAMCAKLESRANHLVIQGATDSIGLPVNIQNVMFQFQSQRYAPLVLHEA